MTEEKIYTTLSSINTKLEYIQKDVEEIKDNIKHVTGRVEALEKNELSHVKNCPQNVELGGVIKRVGDLEKDLEEYRMAKKYPKAVLILIVVFAMVAIGTAISTRQMVSKEIQKLETTVTTAQ